MTTVQMATTRLTLEADATREAQDARWIAWKSKVAADDRVTQRRVRLVFAVVIVFVGVTLAVLL